MDVRIFQSGYVFKINFISNASFDFADYALEQGNYHYKQEQFELAIEVYAGALTHIKELPLDGTASSHQATAHPDTSAHLLLGYSRCSRKLDALEEGKDMLYCYSTLKHNDCTLGFQTGSKTQVNSSPQTAFSNLSFTILLRSV